MRRTASEWIHQWKPLPHQLPPEGDWFIWLMQQGAGAGKNYTGAHWVRAAIDNGCRTVNVAGPTWADTLRTMVRGSAIAPGLMGVWPPHQRPELHASGSDPYMLCHTGAIIQLFAAQKAERFRGPAGEKAWFDEVDSWKPEGMSPEEAFMLAEQRIRIGANPQILCTTTPKRNRLCKSLSARADCVVTRGSMLDNKDNLNPKYVAAQLAKYAGTRIGRQELDGEMLPDVEGAIVSLEMIDANRLDPADLEAQQVDILADLERVVVGVDPFGGGGDACGIVVAGREGTDRASGLHGKTAFVMADRTCKKGPDGWGRRVIETTLEFGADCVAVEKNYGGNMCAHVIGHAAKDMGVKCPRIVEVTSTKAKHVRFERTTGAKYERGEVVHVGTFPALEDEVTQFTPQGYEGTGSPNSADAEVFAIEELFPLVTQVTLAELYPS